MQRVNAATEAAASAKATVEGSANSTIANIQTAASEAIKKEVASSIPRNVPVGTIIAYAGQPDVVVISFRDPIKTLLARVTKHKSNFLGENELLPDPSLSKFLERPMPKKELIGSPSEAGPVQEHLEYYKSAHFYWLGSDLMEAIRSVAVVPNKEAAIQSLSQSLRHFRKAGLHDKVIEERLTWLIDVNGKKLLSDWNSEVSRSDILNEILVIRAGISRLVNSEAGPQFNPWED